MSVCSTESLVLSVSSCVCCPPACLSVSFPACLPACLRACRLVCVSNRRLPIPFNNATPTASSIHGKTWLRAEGVCQGVLSLATWYLLCEAPYSETVFLSNFSAAREENHHCFDVSLALAVHMMFRYFSTGSSRSI